MKTGGRKGHPEAVYLRAGAKTAPDSANRRGAPCIRYARVGAPGQSGARFAPPRNARGRAQARARRIRANWGPAAGGAGGAANGTERKETRCRNDMQDTQGRSVGWVGSPPQNPRSRLRERARRPCNGAKALRGRKAQPHARTGNCLCAMRIRIMTFHDTSGHIAGEARDAA